MLGEAYIAIDSAIMTVLIRVLSEILPKTLGATDWWAMTPSLPPILKFMIVIMGPFIWLTELINNRLGKSKTDIVHNMRTYAKQKWLKRLKRDEPTR
nr:CNNM domain-containing protein [Halomonas populi]